MTTTINASTSSGLVQTADGSGIIKVQSNGVTTNALAWVNFNGTGTVAIRSSYNVSSITDNGTGDYTVNFTNTLSDANYAVASSSEVQSTFNISSKATTNVRMISRTVAGSALDISLADVSIFGN